MSRVFLMKWYHFSVEYFEDLRNVNHCEFLIMRRNDDSGKYILDNNLRTWSELKRERAEELEAKGDDTKDGKENGTSKDVSTPVRSRTVEARRRWGGCPNGCDHDQSFKIRQTLADLVKSDHVISNHAVGLAVSESDSSSISGGSANTTVPNGNATTGSTHGSTHGATHGLTNPSFNGTANSQTLVSRRPASKRFQSQTADEPDAPEFTLTGPQIDVTKARDETVSSPDGTPSFISVDDRLRSRLKSPNLPPRPFEASQLHVGRDFGGTYSGHNSATSDDADSSSEDDNPRRGAAVTPSSSAASPTTTGIPSATATTAPPPPQTTATNPPPKTLGIPPSAIPRHHRPHSTHREQSRMGRGTRANRLGDHHSSDGEHEADGEHEHECGDGDEESGSELTGRELAGGGDEEGMDEVLRAEKEDRSLMGSVY